MAQVGQVGWESWTCPTQVSAICPTFVDGCMLDLVEFENLCKIGLVLAWYWQVSDLSWHGIGLGFAFALAMQ